MDEDDTDFSVSPKKSGSNLASLFELSKKPLQGNSSLTYTAPKPPKGDSTPAKKQNEEKAKGKIIFSKAVHAYLLQNKTYISQGLIGLVISGNHESRIYEIILYKRNKEHLSLRRIVKGFSMTFSSNNYVSYYDNNHQNWSLMFQTATDVEQFSQQIAICKYYSDGNPAKEALVQDQGPSSQHKVNPNSTVEVIYSTFSLTSEELHLLEKDTKERINVNTFSFTPFSKNLIGCGEKCKRIIIIPYSLGNPWRDDLYPDKSLLLEVKVERIVPETTAKPKIVQEGSKSPIDSSGEEGTVIARGAAIKDSLSSTKKANLISRMARMGQATLPMKPGLPAVQSDSEDESPVVSSPKVKMPRYRAIASNSPVSNSSSTSTTTDTSQQISLYQQNDLCYQKANLVYQQLVPVSASQVSSPTADPNLSVFVSESRIQAAELRMGLSKVSEKLDAILTKMQNTSVTPTDSRVSQSSLLDSGGILASIQNMITENENLKGKVEEQKGKIEQQNDRIFHLLELNHKYVEQNSTSFEMQSATETKLKSEMESMQKKELELEESNRRALDRVKSLTEELARSEETNKNLIKRLEESNSETEALRRNLDGNQGTQNKKLESLKGKLLKTSDAMVKLEERLKEVILENETLKSVIKSQKQEIETARKEVEESKTQKQKFEREVQSLKKQVSDEELKIESKIDDFSKVVDKLKNENKSLLKKVEEQSSQNTTNLLTQVMSALKEHFSDSKEYTSSHILAAAEGIFIKIMDGSLESVEKPKVASSGVSKQDVVPAPRKSLQNLQEKEKEREGTKESEEIKTEVKEIEGTKEEAKKSSEITKEVKLEEQESKVKESEPQGKESKMEKNETDDQKKKEEIDSRYKSYDQGWRTTKPPPPPLFDDEDDADDWLI